jgi:hypothetical protein
VRIKTKNAAVGPATAQIAHMSRQAARRHVNFARLDVSSKIDKIDKIDKIVIVEWMQNVRN